MALALVSACSTSKYSQLHDEIVDTPPVVTIGEPSEHDPDLAASCALQELPLLADLATRLQAENFELAQAAARVRQAQLALQVERAAVWPAVTAAVSAERAKSFAAGLNLPDEFLGGGGSPRTQYRGSLAAQWEVDLWNRLGSNARAAALELDAGRAEQEALLASLSAQLADTFATLLQERAVLDVLEDQEAASRRFVELTELRFGQGLTSAVDIVRQRQQLESVRAEAVLAQSRAETMLSRLQVLLGTAGQVALPQELPPLFPPAEAMTSVPAAAIMQRPDVAAAYLRLAANDERTAAAVAARLPALRLNASLFDVSEQFSQLFNDLLWQVAGELAVTLFDAGRLAAQAELAESVAQESLYRYAQVVVQAFAEVRTAIADQVAQQAYLASLEQQLQAARRALTLERRLYTLGQGDYLSVLTALQSFQQVERLRVEARTARFQAQVSLCRALGLPVGLHDGDASA